MNALFVKKNHRVRNRYKACGIRSCTVGQRSRQLWHYQKMGQYAAVPFYKIQQKSGSAGYCKTAECRRIPFVVAKLLVT